MSFIALQPLQVVHRVAFVAWRLPPCDWPLQATRRVVARWSQIADTCPNRPRRVAPGPTGAASWPPGATWPTPMPTGPMRCGATSPNGLTGRAAESDKRNKLCPGSDLTTRPKNCQSGR
ncbi:MAG: hypothetical protein HBSAPP02_23580 [Phycisphaerae bacterium]|nr:MAG: hypothetical protein HBSAPP02_23580 [Phycisphaerae bacterium]